MRSSALVEGGVAGKHSAGHTHIAGPSRREAREMMRLLAGLRGLLVLLITVGAAAGLTGSAPSVDLPDLFPVSSTSACGPDTPPTSYEEPQNSGQFQICGSGGRDFSAENVQDGNSSTRWQSENEISPVYLNFTISDVNLQTSY